MFIDKECGNLKVAFGDGEFTKNINKKEKFFYIWVFFHEHSRFIGQQGKGEAVSLSPILLPPASQT